jgi:hypothetical protein
LGGGGGGGVESVTGNIVDNTDPANPIVNQDQDNLPIPIDLTLADLGLTEVGTDEEMNDALKAYFLANPLAVGEKQILDIRIFDAFPSPEPYLRLEFDDISLFASDYGITDLNDVSEWNISAFSSDFTSVEINGNVAELRGATTGNFIIGYIFDVWDLIDFDLRNISGNCQVNINGDTFSLNAIKIVNCPQIEAISYNLIPSNITVLPATISNMPDMVELTLLGADPCIETIESGALNGCTSLITITMLPNFPNNLTVAQLDNLQVWAQNDAPSNGTLTLSTNENISSSSTVIRLQNKGWTVTNVI